MIWIYLEHGRASREHELVSPEHPPVRTHEGDVQQVFVVADLAEGGSHVGLEVVPPEAVLLLAVDQLVRRPHDSSAQPGTGGRARVLVEL